jgi:hypothetical protein
MLLSTEKKRKSVEPPSKSVLVSVVEASPAIKSSVKIGVWTSMALEATPRLEMQKRLARIPIKLVY